MSKFYCALALLLAVSPALAQKLIARTGHPAAKTLLISAEIRYEGSFQLQRSSGVFTNWVAMTNFNSLPGTNTFSDPRTNLHRFYRLVQLNLPPAITTQPVGTTNLVNQEVRLEAAATGSWPIRYQWFKDTQPVSGATSNKLIFSGKANLSGNYQLVVSNSWGVALTVPAAVKTINPVATSIAGKKIRYVIKGAQGSYIGTGSFETTYNAQGHFNTYSSNAFLNDAANWQYSVTDQGVGRILMSSSFVYPNGSVISLSFTNVNNGTYTLQEFNHSGGQFGEFTFVP